MTGPFRYPDYNATLGTESPVAQSEWSTMLERRRQVIDDLSNRLDLANQLRRINPSIALQPGRDIAEADHTVNQHEQFGTNADGSPTRTQELQAPPHQDELNQLYGAADYWGIPNAKSIPAPALKNIIEAKRLGAAATRENKGVLGELDNFGMQVGGAITLGVTQDLLTMAQHIPFIGSGIAANETVRSASQYLGKLNEQTQAGMSEGERKGYRIAHGLGGMLGYAIPGEVAWKIAGAAGSIGALGTAGSIGRLVTSPIARGAIQGAAATWLLEGGGDQSNQEAAFKVGLGAAGGATIAALGEVLPRVFEKARRAFKTRTDPLNSAELDPSYDWGKHGETVDAEWYFEADHQLPPNGGPPGGTGAGPLGTEGVPEARRIGASSYDPDTYGMHSTAPTPEAPFGTDPFNVAPEVLHQGNTQGMAPEFGGNPRVNEMPSSGQTFGMPGEVAQPQGPAGLLMSPERASMEARIGALTEQRDVARRMLETDPLTGLGNKTALERARGAVDSDPELSWVVFDGKKFKSVNDTHGHDVGDQVLTNFGRAIQQTAQEMQVPSRAFRQGGDEFAAVVPRDQAEAFAARVSELSYQKVGGVETKLDAYHAPEFAEADLSLMANKRSGANGSQITPGNKDGPYYRGQTGDPNSVQASTDAIYFTKDRSVAQWYADEQVDWSGHVVQANLNLGRVASPDDISRIAAARGISLYNPEAPVSFLENNPALVQALREEGFHSARGEEETGDFGLSEVVAVFHPHQVENLTTSQALSEASNLTKQATIMEGDVTSAAGASELDESDVAQAAMFKNPERINVIQGVGDVGKTVRKLTQGMTEGRIMPHEFRLVERNGQMDMLVSDGMPITNKRVAQYKQHGFFEGQQATVNGKSVSIMKVNDEGLVRVYDPYGEQTYLVPHASILPGRSSGTDAVGIAEHGDALYSEFRGRVEDYMQREAAKLPPGAKVDTSWLSQETSSQLPRLLDQYLTEAVGSSPLSRAALDSYFNLRRVQDFRALAPEEVGQLGALNKELALVRAVRPIEHVGVEDIASQKGFSYVPTVGERGGTLVDRTSDLRVPVADEEAASTFLRSFNRDVPDYTPISDVPVEVMGSNPHAANPGNDLEPVPERGTETELPLVHDAADRVEAAVAELNLTPEESASSRIADWAGRQFAQSQRPAAPPPPPPPFPPRGSSIGGPGGQPQLPPGTPALGEQFARAARNRPQDLHKILQRFDSAWLNYMTPFRSLALDMEHQLKSVGITEGTLWKHYNDVVTNVTRAHNEAGPWQAEWADIMSQFRRKHLRNGTVTKIQEIAAYQDQLVAMQKAGYNHSEIQAQKRISDFNDRFFQYLVDDPNYKLDASRYIAGYMSHVRNRQGMPGIADPFAEGDNARLPMELKFFAEMAREGNMQFRQMDARSLGTKMIRAAMFKKHVGESYEAMARSWSDPRIPQAFRELVGDWLKVVHTGHNPHYDVTIQGTKHMLNAMGVPITNGEVATLTNVAFGNMYRAQLGGRPDAIFRDSIQPFFTGVRIGFKPVVAAYNTLLTGGQATRDMIQRGLEGGWLEKGMAKVANADVFEHGINTPEGVSLMTDRQQRTRDWLAVAGDVMWAGTPKSLRSGLQGSRLDPLHYYTKLGEINRVVSGEAGYQTAATAISEYQYGMQQLARGELKRASGVMWADTADSLMGQLLKGSKARAYPQPIQDEFKRLVSNGQVQEAAYLLGNEAANMQFRYGAKENPVGIRKMGNTGRAIMQFGTFTQQYVAQMAEMASGPGVHPAEKVQMLARYGAVQTALGIATAYTGWNFGKWAWHQSLTFAGGPLFQGAQGVVQGITGAAAEAMGANPTPAQKAALQNYSRTTPGDVLSGIASSEFPYSSTIRTAENFYNAANGMNPVEGTARVAVTGEATLQPDIRQFIDALGDRTMDPNAAWRRGGQAARQGSPATPTVTPASGIPPGMVPSDKSVPGMVRLSPKGYMVYDSKNVDPNGQTPTHRLDVPSGKRPEESWEQYEARVHARPVEDFPQEAFHAQRDPNLLHPEVRDSLTSMMAAAAQEGHPLQINETLRSPDRGELLFKKGRSWNVPEGIVTWTLTSDHVTGRAADLQPAGRNREAGFSWIQNNAPRFGFSVMGSNDPGHVSMPEGARMAPQPRQVAGAGAM